MQLTFFKCPIETAIFEMNVLVFLHHQKFQFWLQKPHLTYIILVSKNLTIFPFLETTLHPSTHSIIHLSTYPLIYLSVHPSIYHPPSIHAPLQFTSVQFSSTQFNSFCLYLIHKIPRFRHVPSKWNVSHVSVVKEPRQESSPFMASFESHFR